VADISEDIACPADEDLHTCIENARTPAISENIACPIEEELSACIKRAAEINAINPGQTFEDYMNKRGGTAAAPAASAISEDAAKAAWLARQDTPWGGGAAAPAAAASYATGPVSAPADSEAAAKAAWLAKQEAPAWGQGHGAAAPAAAPLYAAAPEPTYAAAAAAPSGPFNIDNFGGIWSLEAKTAMFNQWDPESPRTYTNFNPFERNDESAQADIHGCFPGQSRGYQSPIRPETSWAIMEAEKVKMDELKLLPKFNIKGRPGNFVRSWQDNLGPVP
jgi:hypothetical protein